MVCPLQLTPGFAIPNRTKPPPLMPGGQKRQWGPPLTKGYRPVGCFGSHVRIAVSVVILGSTEDTVRASGLNDVIRGKGAPEDSVVLAVSGKIGLDERDGPISGLDGCGPGGPDVAPVLPAYSRLRDRNTPEVIPRLKKLPKTVPD